MRNPFRRGKKNTPAAKLQNKKRVDATAAGAWPAMAESSAGAVDGRLVVMGRESTFSEEVIDYAIDMARRMSFEILALNSAPLSCDAFSLFSTSRSKLCQEFQAISEKNALAFRQTAEAEGVPFIHVVKFDEPEQALASVQSEYGHVEFVISDAQPQGAADRVAESDRPRNELLVYSMI